VVGDGRHLPEERPAVLDQPVSNPLAFSGSPHATLRFPKLPRRGCETTAGSTEGWSNHLAFRIAGELWRRRDERTPFVPSRRDSNPCFSLERASPWVGISPTSLTEISLREKDRVSHRLSQRAPLQQGCAGMRPIAPRSGPRGIISGTPLCARRCRAPGCSGSRSWGPASPGILTICVGEMCQRVIVAMALAHSPKLRITDEPTAGLDVTLQVLGPMRGLVRAANSSVLLVSPDLGVIAHHRLRLRAPPLRSSPVGDEERPDVGLDSMFIQHYIMYIRLSL